MKTHTRCIGVFLLCFLFPAVASTQVYNYVITPDYVREARGVSLTYDEASNRTLFTGVFEDSLHWRGTSFGENREGLYVGSFDNATNAQILFSIRLPAIVSAYVSSHFLEVDDQSNIYLAGVLSNTLTNFPLPVEWGDSTIMFGPNTPHPGSNGIPFITKLAPDGRHLWTKFGEEGYFRGFAVDHAGNFIFLSYNNTASSYGHAVDTTQQFISHYLVKLDPLGNYLWGRSVRGDFIDPFGLVNLSLTTDHSNNILVGLRSKPENSSLILEGSSYDSLLLPAVQHGTTGILMKFQADGELDQVRYAHSDDGANSVSIQTDEDNNVFWLGGFRGTNFSLSGFNPSAPVSGYSSFVAKYDSLGALEWVDYADFSNFGNSISPYDLHYIKGNLYLEGVHIGNPILGAYRFPDRLLGGPTNFIAKYLPNRNIAWVHQEQLYTGDGTFGNSVPFFPRTILANGEFLTTGYIKQASSFDNIVVTPLFRRNYPVITSFQDTTFNQGFTEPGLVEGVIFIDSNQDCSRDSMEQGLANWLVRADPGPLHAMTDTNGYYALPLDSGQYTLTALPPPSFLFSTTSCANPLPLTVPGPGQQISDADVGVYIDTCFQMSLHVSSSRRRLCFPSNTTVTYCNTGLHAAPPVPLYVNLPEHLSFISASESFTWDADSNLVFQTEVLDPGECRTILLRGRVDCGVELLGLSQCARAWMEVPEPCEVNNPSWSLASLEIEKECQNGDTILFVIENTGQGDMADSTEYRLFRDTVLVKQENILLRQNEQFQLVIPSNGLAYRLEVDQVANHPGNPIISDWIGDCFSTNTATFAANIAPFFPDPEPRSAVVEDIDCLPITGSYDPNDKQVKPLGVTDQNFVKPGRKLDYKIRFQNTGTDTAFTVVLIDTLSEHLNPATFQALGSSHPYSVRMESSGQTRLIITYNDILLPDSTTDLAGSQGFFSFSIDPYSNLPDSTEVRNFADIYFDYNPPVRTNTVRTTYYDFMYTNLSEGDSIQTMYTNTTSVFPLSDLGKLTVFPNPNRGTFQLAFEEWPTGNYSVVLYDKLGAEMYRSEARILHSSQTVEVDVRQPIAAGVYFLRIGEGITRKVLVVD